MCLVQKLASLKSVHGRTRHISPTTFALAGSFGLCPKLPANTNCVGLLYTAIRGGTDAAGYKPPDFCVSKLEFNSVQGCTLLNG